MSDFATPRIVEDDRMPVGAVAIVSVDHVVGFVGGEIHEFRLSSLGRKDCTFPRCQLSLGHPLPHCVEDLMRSARYLIIDDTGKVLREV